MTTEPSWPIEYPDQLILGNLDCAVAICCFWMPRERLSRRLSSSSYCVLGNLYSRAGINAMLRNILAKPSIRYLVLVGNSLTDSDEALLNFFNSGVDARWRVVGNGAQIDRQLPLEALNDIRENVAVIDLRNSRNFESEFAEITQNAAAIPFSQPRQFPPNAPDVIVFPSEFTGFVVRQRTLMEVWRQIIWSVMTFGHTSSTDYGLAQKELLGLLSIIEEPNSLINEIPGWAPFQSADIDNYLRQFFERDKDEGVEYNYGYRLQSHWHDQVESMVSELNRAGHSRRALASLWDPQEDSGSADPVCLTTIQAAIRDGQLHLMTYIRSNDMFRAYPLNAVALIELQRRIETRLPNVGLGCVEILSYSAHIYSDCWNACQAAINEISESNSAFEQDPRGSFVFRTDGTEILVDHYSPASDLLQTLRAQDAQQILGLILPFVSRLDHAAYLGREAYRAQEALRTGGGYLQDEA